MYFRRFYCVQAIWFHVDFPLPHAHANVRTCTQTRNMLYHSDVAASVHRLMPLVLEEALKMTSVQIPVHVTDDQTRPTNTIVFAHLNLLNTF